jgi:predicted nucleic acid-binding protein
VTVALPVFVDTNILLYARDTRDQRKQAAAQAWLEHLARARQGRISTQVLFEFYAAATHSGKLSLPTAKARADVEALAHWCPVASDATLWREAWRLADRYGFSWWDSLIVAAAVSAGCGTLLSEDFQDGMAIGPNLTVVNPLVPGAPGPG